MSQPLSNSALLGFVGGEEQVGAARASFTLYRKGFVSMYNSPGTYITAKRLTALSKARVFSGLPGVSVDPAALYTDNKFANGPKYTASFSGTTLSATGPLAKALLEHSRTITAIETIGGRVTIPTSVTVVELADAPEPEVHPTAKGHAPVLIPVLASGAAAAVSGVYGGDWTIFGMIVLGMICNGVSSTALRQGDLTFTRPKTAPGAPAGDGYLEAGNELIALKGSEGAVASITRGTFALRYKNDESYRWIATCGTFLTAQCFIQLLVVPTGTFVGQAMFLFSMVVSWLYNAHVARQEKAAWDHLVLQDLLKAPTMKRYSLGTRAATAVFLMQLLKPTNVEEQLQLLLPNTTPVWRTWRQTVAKELRNERPSFAGVKADTVKFTAEETKLFTTLLGDAQAAVDGFAKLSGAKY